MTTAESAGEEELPANRLTLPQALLWISPAIAILFIVIVPWRNHNALTYGYGHNVADHGDYNFFVNAGKVITRDAPTNLYSRTQPPDFRTIHGYGYPVLYPYAPAAAVATAPFGLFNYDTGYKIWRVFVALTTVCFAVCVASAFRSWPWRIAMALAIGFWYPVLMNAHIGQTGTFISAGVIVSVIVFLRNKRAGAVMLGVLGVKPTAAIGPGLFLIQERPATWLRFAVTAFLLVMIPFIYLGPTQFWHWLQILKIRGWGDISGGHSYNQGFSSIFGSSTEVGLVMAACLLVIAVLLTRTVRLGMGPLTAMAFAMIIGAMVNPHSLLYDWGTAFVAIFLLRKARIFPDESADLLFGGLAILLFICGQYSFSLRHEIGHGLRPLTVWAMAVDAALFVVAVMRLRSGAGAMEPEDDYDDEPYRSRTAGMAPAAARPSLALPRLSLPRIALPKVSVTMSGTREQPGPKPKAPPSHQKQSRAARRRDARR